MLTLPVASCNNEPSGISRLKTSKADQKQKSVQSSVDLPLEEEVLRKNPCWDIGEGLKIDSAKYKQILQATNKGSLFKPIGFRVSDLGEKGRNQIFENCLIKPRLDKYAVNLYPTLENSIERKDPEIHSVDKPEDTLTDKTLKNASRSLQNKNWKSFSHYMRSLSAYELEGSFSSDNRKKYKVLKNQGFNGKLLKCFSGKPLFDLNTGMDNRSIALVISTHNKLCSAGRNVELEAALSILNTFGLSKVQTFVSFNGKDDLLAKLKADFSQNKLLAGLKGLSFSQLNNVAKKISKATNGMVTTSSTLEILKRI